MISELELLVDQMLAPELDRMRQASVFEDDKAVAARLMIKLMKPIALWFLEEEKSATSRDKMHNAIGQAMGNMMLVACARAKLRGHYQAQALKNMMDTAVVTIGVASKRTHSGIIIP